MSTAVGRIHEGSVDELYRLISDWKEKHNLTKTAVEDPGFTQLLRLLLLNKMDIHAW